MRNRTKPGPRQNPAEIHIPTLRAIAHIMGNGAAANKAIAELQQRRADGEDVTCYVSGPMYFVGPRVKQ